MSNSVLPYAAVVECPEFMFKHALFSKLFTTRDYRFNACHWSSS
jgi:hypothetical protein